MSKMKRLTALVMAVILCICLSVPAYAEEIEEETAVPAVISDVTVPMSTGDLQFIEVQSRNNHSFYIIIDRSGRTEQVYFLDQVDENDLISLLKEEGYEEYAKCTCEDKCSAGDVNQDCLVCRLNLKDCIGQEKAPAVQPTAAPSVSQHSTVLSAVTGISDMNLLIMGAVLGLILLAVLYILVVSSDKPKKKKKKPKAPAEEEIDFDDEDDDDEDDPEDEE